MRASNTLSLYFCYYSLVVTNSTNTLLRAIYYYGTEIVSVMNSNNFFDHCNTSV